VSWWIFVVAGILSLLIAWITVAYQSVRAALSNPITSLRYE
jgi:putative ABC transport system permease protein